MRFGKGGAIICQCFLQLFKETGLDKRPVYNIIAIKLLWLKPDKYYVTRKGSHLTSA